MISLHDQSLPVKFTSVLKRASDIYNRQGPYSFAKNVFYYIFIRKPVPERVKFHAGNRIRWTAQRLHYEFPARPTKRIQITVDEVSKYTQNSEFDQAFGFGYIRDGDWDITNNRIEDHFIFKGLTQHFEWGYDWEETDYVEFARKTIDQRGYFWGYDSIDKFIDERCSYVDNLYENINTQGYKSSLETTQVDTNRHPGDYYPSVSEVAVGIGREGEVLLYDGFHRVTIAKLLDIEEIPAMVIVRHTSWQELRDQLYSESDRPTSTHPDLNDI